MSRKDDPVFNVKFVQLIEQKKCLWDSTNPAYSKKHEVQKAWQEVANEIKDTVRNCRERWRTIRSSFLRSLKLAHTTTGRGKRKYYLSKYLQFLIPHTKTRIKHTANLALTTLRKTDELPPMTHINNMPMPIVSSDDTKDSTNSEIAIAEDDVVVSLHEEAQQQQQLQQLQQSHTLQLPPPLQHQPYRLPIIKTEQDFSSPDNRRYHHTNNTTNNNTSITTTNTTLNGGFPSDSSSHGRTSSVVDLMEFAEWIKIKNNNNNNIEQHRHCLMTNSLPDANQSFLNSLHPFLKEMTGKQNRHFRQKIMVLIDSILESSD